MAELEIRHIVQWAMAGAKNALDPRAAMIGGLSRSSSLDPNNLVITEKGLDIEIKGTFKYSEPNLPALKKKKFKMDMRSEKIDIVIKDWELAERRLEAKVSQVHRLPLNLVLLSVLLHVILSDVSKRKTFKSLIKTTKGVK